MKKAKPEGKKKANPLSQVLEAGKGSPMAPGPSQRAPSPVARNSTSGFKSRMMAKHGM
jgi:hypothetical protein